MQSAIVVGGRLTGPRHVELDESVEGLKGDVEVILRARRSEAAEEESVSQLLRRLPSGTRSREEIDRQLREDRGEWDGRA